MEGTIVTSEVLDSDRVAGLLRGAGVETARSRSIPSAGETAQAFEALGAPRAVLKAGGLLHKSDVGGVVLGLEDASAAAAAAHHMVDRLGEDALPLLLQEQMSGIELLVGARRDPQLGAAVVVGLGGTAAEVHQDVVTMMAPVSPRRVRRHLQDLRIWPLLEGFRGEPGRDIEALVAAVVAVSEIVSADRHIVELDLNPIMVGDVGAGAVAVDARVICDEDVSQPPERPYHDLDRMLRPKHVAVVGVSDNEHKVGSRTFRYLDQHGFPGRLDPVHPAGGHVRGYERSRSLLDIDGSPDLVCVTVPRQAVLEVARDAVEKKVGGLLVHSSDFAEVGDEGRAVQRDLVDILADGGVPLAGPNNMGIVAPHQGLTASISGGLESPLVAGSVALLTSSGALGSCLATRLMGAGVGLSYWIHAGNEADLVIADYLEWLAADDQTDCVVLLLEDIKDGPALIRAGEQVAKAGRPMFAYNMVRTDRGRQAALSHTGAIVGSFQLREAVVREAGMVSVPSLRVLEDAAVLVSQSPRPSGNRLAAVTFSGGACSIIADHAQEVGIDLPELTEHMIDALRPHLPSYAAVRNPLDCSYQMLSRADAFEQVMAVLAESGRYDAILLQLTTNADPYATDIAKKVVNLNRELHIPLYVSRYGGEQLAPQALRVYREAGQHILDAPDRATLAIGAVMSGQRAIGASGAAEVRP